MVLVLIEESRCFSRSGIRFLFPIEVQQNSLHNVLKEAKIQSKGWFGWLIRGMMKSLEV